MCGGSGHNESAGDAAAELDSMLKNEARQKKNEVKILLLGAGESGKSTLVKQMRIIHNGNDAFPPDERDDYKEVIMSNTIQSIRVVLDAMESLDPPIQLERQESAPAAELLLSLDDHIANDNGRMPLQVVEAIKIVWADNGVRRCVDSATYYFDAIDRIGAQQGYTPSDQDILRARVKTTGISEYFFKVGQMTLRMMDVGGQRSERRKWASCFEDVNSVIFLAALSEYDQVLYEDETTNRMSEALVLFDSIANSRWFKQSSILLFLNKVDLFRQKIRAIGQTLYIDGEPNPKRLSAFFKDFNQDKSQREADERDSDPRVAGEFLRSLFLSRNANKDHEIYTHFTCSVDTQAIRVVMEAVTDTLLKQTLRSAGLY